METTITESEKLLLREYQDVVDPITYTILIVFIITVFMNITYLESSDPDTASLALKSLAIALICITGITAKLFFDSGGVTKTKVSPASKADLLRIFMWTGILFGLQTLIFILILQVFPQSLFFQSGILFAFAIISSTSEEFFFTYGLQSFITKYSGFWGVFAVAGVFMFYHWVVYSSTILLLIMMFILRVIYGSAYYYCRRLSALILAHLITNMIGLVSVAFI